MGSRGIILGFVVPSLRVCGSEGVGSQKKSRCHLANVPRHQTDGFAKLSWRVRGRKQTGLQNVAFRFVVRGVQKLVEAGLDSTATTPKNPNRQDAQQWP